MRWIHAVLRAALLTLLIVLCAALFYVLVIMGGTTQDVPGETASVATYGPLAAMPQDTLSLSAQDLTQAEAYFNAPIMRLSAYSGWQLTGVQVLNTQPEGVGGTVREVRLQYANEGGEMVTVSSLTPSDCLRALPAKGFTMSTDQDWSMGGLSAVMMRKENTLHLHAQRGDTVYQIEGEISADTMRQLTGAIEL